MQKNLESFSYKIWGIDIYIFLHELQHLLLSHTLWSLHDHRKDKTKGQSCLDFTESKFQQNPLGKEDEFADIQAGQPCTCLNLNETSSFFISLYVIEIKVIEHKIHHFIHFKSV